MSAAKIVNTVLDEVEVDEVAVTATTPMTPIPQRETDSLGANVWVVKNESVVKEDSEDRDS